MENPATWTEIERTIAEALREAAEARANLLVGLSTPRLIADALRKKGLVKE